MKKRIIAFIDLTEKSHNLIKYAGEWCVQAHAELLIVHQSSAVTPVFTDDRTRDNIIYNFNQNALKKLKEVTYDILPSTLDVTFLVTEKNLVSVLEELLPGQYENLLLLGLEKVGFFKKMFFGSTALQLIENSPHLIAAIPTEIESYSYEKIYVAVPEKHHFNVLGFHRFLKFIDPTETTITFFYLTKPNETIKAEEKKLRELVELFSLKYNTLYEIYEGTDSFKDIKHVINNKIDEILVVQKGADLISDRIFGRFLVKELVLEGQTPLIILP